MTALGKFLIVTGLLVASGGLILWGLGAIPYFGQYFGRLPGDIYLRRGSFSFYFPLATCILLSLVISLLLLILPRR